MRVLCFTLRKHIFNKHGYFANPPFITLGTILISKEGYKPIRIHNTIKFNLRRSFFNNFVEGFNNKENNDLLLKYTHIKFYYILHNN